MIKNFTMQQIADAVGGQLTGDGTLNVSRLCHPSDSAGPQDLVLAMDGKLEPLLEGAKARAVVLGAESKFDTRTVAAAVLVSRPRLAMAQLTALFAETVAIPAGIHPTAIIEPGARIGANVTIGAYASICAGATIGAHSVLHPQTYVGPNAVIGAHALIYPGVRIGSRVQIGDRAIIHFNASIGSDGFSFVTPQMGSVEAAKATGEVGATNNTLIRIASLGSVIIGNDVEIGANTSIDRGTIVSTRIGHGTKIDNQVQIGHNVVIGDNCMLCGQSGVAGSSELGNRVVLGGGVGVADHLKIGDDAVVMGMSGVAGHIAPRTVVGGIPAMPREKLIENHFYLGRIKNFMKKLEAFTQRLDALEQNNKSV